MEALCAVAFEYELDGKFHDFFFFVECHNGKSNTIHNINIFLFCLWQSSFFFFYYCYKMTNIPRYNESKICYTHLHILSSSFLFFFLNPITSLFFFFFLGRKGPTITSIFISTEKISYMFSTKISITYFSRKNLPTYINALK